MPSCHGCGMSGCLHLQFEAKLPKYPAWAHSCCTAETSEYICLCICRLLFYTKGKPDGMPCLGVRCGRHPHQGMELGHLVLLDRMQDVMRWFGAHADCKYVPGHQHGFVYACAACRIYIAACLAHQTTVNCLCFTCISYI